MLWYKINIFSMLMVACAFTLFANTNGELNHYMLRDTNNIALQGYDPVSYFDENPLKGKQEYQTNFAEVTWLFANQSNLDKFLRSPEEYLPEYHGYCVWAIRNDRLMKGLLEYWEIHNGKLYFLCSKKALQNWLENPDTHTKKANENWQNMLDDSLNQ
jgi:YHS domain-containing protein